MNQLPIGTKFYEEYKGLTMSGFGKVVECWEVDEYLGNDLVSCKLINSNTVPSINPKYRQKFSVNTINELIK